MSINVVQDKIITFKKNKGVCINLEWFCDTKGNLFNSKTP